MNLIFYLLFLVPLAVIGIACSYTDIKYKKIFNKWIILGFIYILCLYGFLLFFLGDNSYVFSLILNGLIAFSIGYLLWYFRLWSAGDTKLFAIYAFLVPLQFYSKSYVSYFPSFNLLVNLFIPILFVIAGSALITSFQELCKISENRRKIKQIDFKKTPQTLLRLCQFYLNYVFIFIVLQAIVFPLTENLPASEIFKNPFLIFALLLLIIGNFHKARKEKKQLNWIFYGVILAYFLIIVVFKQDFNTLINMLKIALIFMVFIGFTRSILNFYIQKKEIKEIEIKDITEGMIPVENKSFLTSGKIKEKLGILDAGGLNENQVKIIKDFFKNSAESKIKVYKTLPFAPFLLLSTAISIYTQSSFLSRLDELLQILI